LLYSILACHFVALYSGRKDNCNQWHFVFFLIWRLRNMNRLLWFLNSLSLFLGKIHPQQAQKLKRKQKKDANKRSAP
jgi:hypothetical protein